MATFSGLTLNKAALATRLWSPAPMSVTLITERITVTPAATPRSWSRSSPQTSVTAGSGFGVQATIEEVYGNMVKRPAAR